MADGTIKTGSSVVEVEWFLYGRLLKLLPISNEGGTKLKGEAAFVDLGEGRYLFALLKDVEKLAAMTFIEPGKRYWKVAGPVIADSSFKGAVNPQDYPMLVTFKDISDPASVQKVYPNNLAASFGRGVKLKRIMLEITNEPVTNGEVEKVLGWLTNLKGRYLHGGRTSRGAPLGLYGGHFEQGN